MAEHESLVLLNAIAESTPDLIWAVDAQQFSLLFYNRAAAEFFRRIDADDVALGLRPDGLFASGSPSANHWRAFYRRALSESGLSTEHAISAAGQHWLLSCSLIRRSDEAFAISVLGRDISAFKKADTNPPAKGVPASETFYRTMLETGQDVHLVMDADGRITFVSQSASRVFGWTEQELLQTRHFDRVHPDDREKARRVFDQVACAAEDWIRTSFRLQHKDGGWRTTLGSARNCLSTPEIRGILLVMRDVTDEVKREEELRQAQKMESVGQLAGGVAHDFNNLLTVILGNSEALLEDDDDPRRSREALLQIQSAGKRAAALTRQLLAFSRRQLLSPQVFDLNAAVAEMRRMLRRILRENVAIELDLEKEPLLIEADRGQIDQVLLNLALNAGDAMPGGGTLFLTVHAAHDDEADGAPTRPVVVLTVTDTGGGIPPDVLPRIFEPFFTTKELGKGTGLGLATVYGIVEQSKGRITVQSEPGKGTTFKIMLPRIDRSRWPAERLQDKRGKRSGSGVILVAEDDDDLRRLIRATLERYGFQVIEATNGTRAEVLFRDCDAEIDLVISDMVMPGISGQTLAQRLRERKPDLKVLLVSGYVDADGEGWSLHTKNEFLPKPFSAAELFDKVEQILGRKK